MMNGNNRKENDMSKKDLFDKMFKGFDCDKYFKTHKSLEEDFGGDFGKEKVD